MFGKKTDKSQDSSVLESQVEEQQAEPIENDRSAFNCPDCGGEGLVSQDKVCSSCNGTGKMKNEFSGMPKGTVVITKAGSFKIGENGEMIKQEE